MQTNIILLLFIPVLILHLFYFPTHVFSAPHGTISPACAPVDEFEMVFNVDGFISNYSVSWDFIGPDEIRVMHGYFATNSTGGFNEDAEVEPIIPGEHKLVLYDDIEHDSIVDVNGTSQNVTINIPCS